MKLNCTVAHKNYTTLQTIGRITIVIDKYELELVIQKFSLGNNLGKLLFY